MSDSTPMQDAATAVHEYYTSLIDAGFNPKQALYLTGQMLAGQNNA